MSDEPFVELATRAKKLLPILREQARRSFVLEVTGTPKAGKTTSVTVLQRFFKDCGFRVHVLKEKAAECPLSMKGHFFFNTWTACSMLAEVLATVDTNVDLLILDRGFLDASIWLELQCQKGQVTEAERKAFETFFLLERWRGLVDATIVVTTSPENAIQRENAPLIVPRSGSVMNPAFLNDFNLVLAEIRSRYSAQFRLLEIDTYMEGPIREANAQIVERLLPLIDEWADPRIAVLDRHVVERTLGSDQIKWGADASECWKVLAPAIRAVKRSTAERDASLVQLVACGVPMRGEKVFVLQRANEDDRTSRYGRHTIWKGCHVPSAGAELSLEELGSALSGRLREDLHLGGTTLECHFRAVVWQGDAMDSKHLGLFFLVPVEDSIARTLQDKEFRRSGRGHTLSGSFRQRSVLLEEREVLALEPWSVEVLGRLD